MSEGGAQDAMAIAHKIVADNYTYKRPNMLVERIAAAIQQARAETREACAQLADAEEARWIGINLERAASADAIAIAIRAGNLPHAPVLPETPEDT